MFSLGDASTRPLEGLSENMNPVDSGLLSKLILDLSSL